MLQEKVGGGYTARDAAKVLSAYAADAQIGTYVRGLVKKAELGEMVAADIAIHKSMKADLSLEKIALSGGEASAKMRIVLEGELAAGGGTRRGDTFYLKLRCGEGWEIFLQTYLSDYSLPPDAHIKLHEFK